MEKHLFPLLVERGAVTERMTLGILQHRGVAELGTEFLSADEHCIYNTFKVDRRRSEFLAGRYIAKEAVRKQHPEFTMESINIVHGVWGFPLIHTPGLQKTTISIGHTERCAVALFYSSNILPIGVDMEEIKEANMPAFRRFISSSERELIASGQYTSLPMMHLLWSAKEAAGKALKVGFTIPEELYVISSIECEQDFYRIGFKNLSMVTVTGWVDGDFAICIAYPSVWKLGKINERAST